EERPRPLCLSVSSASSVTSFWSIRAGYIAPAISEPRAGCVGKSAASSAIELECQQRRNRRRPQQRAPVQKAQLNQENRSRNLSSKLFDKENGGNRRTGG